MTPKTKKRTLIMALSLMITLTACENKEDHRANVIAKSKYLAKVSNTKELSEDIEPIRFMEYYIYFDKKQKNKKLTLGEE